MCLACLSVLERILRALRALCALCACVPRGSSRGSTHEGQAVSYSITHGLSVCIPFGVSIGGSLIVTKNSFLSTPIYTYMDNYKGGK